MPRKRDAGPDEAVLRKMSPEQAAEVRRLWKRKVEMERAARLNPIGFYRPLPTQLKFHQSVARKRLLCGGNRCQPPETMVWGNNGCLTTIEDLTDDSVVYGAVMGRKRKFCTTPVVVGDRFIDDGYRITTKRGYVTEGTEDHPVWACPPAPPRWHNGVDADAKKGQWVFLKDLPEGWYIQMVFGCWWGWEYDEDEEAYIHGLMRGDGSELCNYGVLKFTGHCEESLIPTLRSHLDARGIHNRTYKKSGGGLGRSLEWCNLDYKRKFVGWEPTWDAKTTSSYIRGLFDTEGCVTDHSFVIVNTEIDLLRWVHRALLSFGIKSSFREIPPQPQFNRPSPSARLSISGFSCKNYMKSIGFGEKRKLAKAKIIAEGRRSPLCNRFWWERVAKKELIKGREFVPMSTGTETYVGDGFLSHNSGKTEAGAAELLFWILGKSPYREVQKGPITIVVSSLSFDLQRHTIIETLSKLLPEKGLELIWTRDEKVLKGPNGVVSFKSDEQGWKSFQGRALDAFWLDEEHSYETYRQLSKRLKAGRRIESWYTMTPEPDMPDHWTHEELVQKAYDPNSGVEHFEISLDENRKSRGGYIDDEEIDNLIANTPLEERPAIIHGKYVRRGGLIYPMWSKSEHVEEEKPLKAWLHGIRNGSYTAFCWLDWGVRNPTAIGLVLEGKDGDIHLVDEIYHPATDVTEIKRQWNERFAMFSPKFVAADPSIWNNHDSTDPSRTVAGQLSRNDRKLRLNGLPLMKGDNDVTNGFAACRELLRVDPQKGPIFTVQPRCVNFIREIEGYVGDEWVNAPHSRNKKETPRKKNDHHMDGFRYFGLSPHTYITPRWKQRVAVPVHADPVTGYLRYGA